jgi:glutamyl-tRNA reductase
LDERQRKIVSDLTSILLKQMFLPVLENLREAAANDEKEPIKAAKRLFEIEQ